MTRLDALRALLAKVEAGELDFRDDIALNDNWPAKLCLDKTWQAYQGSLDAAKALHEALLPGWRITAIQHASGRWRVAISDPIPPHKETWALSEDPALALLSCDLRALIAQEEAKA
ncbi:hypothetical protein ACFSDD_11115 [Salipiger marinus]|uniref:hypothetical protein n=1 Tax=Salipiger marinus TaxID=555512 RepID=UPI002BD42005|nr:hypothetical protein [Salipiger manganoxidans]MEB3419921.1 hypothetical protein [Salipiger manganoxidans]